MTTSIDYGIVRAVPVYFDDLDAMRMVHNARYAVLLERAIGTYWTELGWAYDEERSAFPDVLLPVREFTITYHAPIPAVAEVAVHFWIERMGRTSVVYGFRMLSADHTVTHAEGRRAQVRIDATTMRPTEISPELRAAAQPLRVPLAS
ncbi:MAG: acyl-CoA thioesterase [Micromonosporaceae bacterium]